MSPIFYWVPGRPGPIGGRHAVLHAGMIGSCDWLWTARDSNVDLDVSQACRLPEGKKQFVVSERLFRTISTENLSLCVRTALPYQVLCFVLQVPKTSPGPAEALLSRSLGMRQALRKGRNRRMVFSKFNSIRQFQPLFLG
jgi:hypothetical protein